ncbi:hypothetical protein DFH27DRAFT_231924 [Peziza echinospora]|nr:hypothetical protein DFH27DRAFT_231924 [Peziza echinospora]
MKKIFSTKKKEKSQTEGSGMATGGLFQSQEQPTAQAQPASASKEFCESGGPSGQQSGEEVLFLPTIVDSAESSPTAAKEAANTIRKYLDMKYNNEPQLQYNAIMLMRILADNPGPTFTRNLDGKFADKVKELFKHGRDPGVRQILAETLDHFDLYKTEDEGLYPLRHVWQKQKAIMAKYHTLPGAPTNLQGLGFPRPSARVARTSLPPLEELVGRISEAQMSAKLLHQVLSSTPRNEILENELVKEFVHRCRSASTSMADFITCDSPPPDSDTLSTLIETNDIIRIALARFDAIKESFDMANPQEPAAAGTTAAGPAPAAPLASGPVNPASRNDGPPDLDNPFSDPQALAPLTYPGGGSAPIIPGGGARSRSPAARLPKIDTRRSSSDTSPVSPVVRTPSFWFEFLWIDMLTSFSFFFIQTPSDRGYRY